jgi:hypothetical protein
VNGSFLIFCFSCRDNSLPVFVVSIFIVQFPSRGQHINIIATKSSNSPLQTPLSLPCNLPPVHELSHCSQDQPSLEEKAAQTLSVPAFLRSGTSKPDVSGIEIIMAKYRSQKCSRSLIQLKEEIDCS